MEELAESGIQVWESCVRQVVKHLFQVGAYRLFPVFCSGNCFENILCFFCSILHIVFDGVLFCIQDCHRFFAGFFDGHQGGTTCGKCNRDVFARKISTLYFLRCKQMKIQFFPKALKGNLKNEVLKAAFAAGSAGYFFQRTRAG